MAARFRQSDDLDFVLLDALRDVSAAAPDPVRVWGALRTRIERARSLIRWQPVVGTLSYPPPRGWTLDWHLYISGASMLRLR